MGKILRTMVWSIAWAIPEAALTSRFSILAGGKAMVACKGQARSYPYR